MEQTVSEGWVEMYAGSPGGNVLVMFEPRDPLHPSDSPVRLTQKTSLKFNGFDTTLSIVMSHLAAPTMKGKLGVWAKAVADDDDNAVTAEFTVSRR